MALFDALEAFEQDLHRHVHEENNILLPRVRGPHPSVAAATASLASRYRTPETPGEPSGVLRRCCQAWIAEQTHIWAAHRQ